MARPDLDIEEDIQNFIAHYPPLNHDRKHLHIEIVNGVVTVRGHVQTPNTKHYLIENLQKIEGVAQVQTDDLHDDETLRLEAGRIVPPGIQVSVDFGVIVLTGRSTDPNRTDLAVAEQLARLPGVKKVVSKALSA